MGTTANLGLPYPENTDPLANIAAAVQALAAAIDSGPGGAWTAYTPTPANFTVGNGTLVGRYRKVGKTVFFRVMFTSGTTSSYTGTASTVSLPVPAHASMKQIVPAFMNLNVAGVASINAGANVATPLFSSSASNPLLSGVASTTFNPGAGTGGFWVIEGSYEAA